MAEANNEALLKKHNLRLCRINVWTNYAGLGFRLDNKNQAPYVVESVESNSPAAAAGLRIRDVILAVNDEELSDAEYKSVTTAILNAKNSGEPIELLVIEKAYYDLLNDKGVEFDSRYAKTIESPEFMPAEYANFPKYVPRTCEVRLVKGEDSFGFELANGDKDIGVFIQDVRPDTPASRTSLRKCDRIIEIDDKLVDKESSKSIMDKIRKGKEKRAIKLYVVDTHTYKYFQEKNIPLDSKKFKKSDFAKNYQPTPSYENIAPPTDTGSRPVSRPPAKTTDDRTSRRSVRSTVQDTHQDDIRLCTINRASATDTFGFEMVPNKRENSYSVKLKNDRKSGKSNAALAGIQNDDYLIEVNGENIELLNDEQAKRRIIAVTYPRPLQLLVTDAATYNYYKQNNRTIDSTLPSVKKLPENPVNPRASTQEDSPTRPVSTVTSSQDNRASSGIAGLVTNNPVQPNIPVRNLQGNQRQCRLYRGPGVRSFGFKVKADATQIPTHKISEVGLDTPAEQCGLRVDDYIISVNGQDVQHISSNDFSALISGFAKDLESDPLVLVVTNEYPDPDTPAPVVDDTPGTRTASNVTDVDEDYPEIRLCTIKSFERHQRIGFEITQSPRSYGGNDGFRIQQLERDSPAAKTDIHNGDYIIEVNGKNIEQERYQHVEDLIRDKYQKDQQIKLLVIDEKGYKWYKDHRLLIDTISRRANIVDRATPDPPVNGNDRRPSVRHDSTPKPPTQSSANVYKPTPNDDVDYRQTPRPTLPFVPPINRPLPTRGAIDIISGKRFLRLCHLKTTLGQPFGFQLRQNDNNNIVYGIEEDSPAARAGLNENDRIVEINDENVENQSTRDVASLIRNATHDNKLLLLIEPYSVKPLGNRPANNDQHFRPINDDHGLSSLVEKYQTTSPFNNQQNGRPRTATLTDFNNQPFEPSEPFPRKCVLMHDSSFRGCGLRVTRNENYDTPIIVEIYPNSPAKRSGLTVGDHIIYIDNQNVQQLQSFDNITHLIQQTFDKNSKVTLVTLTGPAYQVLKRRGGYLEEDTFDYQSPATDKMKPFLCKLNLYNHEHDFGFQFDVKNCAYITSVEPGTSADTYGIRKNDIILEINGHDTKYLSKSQIKDIIEKSKQDRNLNILIIDIDGYRYATKHAIPLNSLLSFVQTREGRVSMTTDRIEHESVYI